MKIIAWDTETKGLDWWDPDQQAFLATWADEDGEYCADLSNPEQTARFTAAINTADVVVAHNLAFDIHQTRETLGLDVLDSNVELHDTDLMSRVLHPEGQRAGRGGHGLKNLAKVYLRQDAAESEDAIKEMGKQIGLRTLKQTGAYFDVWRAYPEVMERYATNDARFTYDLYMKFAAELGDERRIYDLEMAVAPVLIRAEERGIRVDPDAVVRLKAEYEQRLQEVRAYLEDEIGAEALGGEGSGEALTEALLALGVPLYRKTASGQLATHKFALHEFAKDFPQLAKLEEYRTLSRFISTYVKAVEGRGTVHASFQQCEAWTGRMCIAAGTRIDAPRNLVASPLGLRIEDIRPGDIVYSHDEGCVPRPKRVLQVFRQGRRRVLKLVWRASGPRGYMGELRATPCHRVRLANGTYRRMDGLQPGDRLAFLARTIRSDGYAALHWGERGKHPEHRLLLPDAEIVHHVDGNPYNNDPTNLSALSRADHRREHSSGGPARECPIPLEEFAVLVEQRGLSVAQRLTGSGYRAVRRWAVEAGVPESSLRRRNKYMEPVNHSVVAVVDEGEWTDTYDLEIENTVCFVANEIAVHNSCRRPNMQNWPKRAGKEVRAVFVPREGCAFVVADYESIEVRLLAHYLGDQGFRRLIADGLDPHAWMAANIWGGETTAYVKGGPQDHLRSLAKNILFAITYGAGAPRIADMLADAKFEADDLRATAKSIIAKIKSSLPNYYGLQKRIRSKIESVGYVNTLFGRKNPVNPDKAYVGLNALIQGSAADIMKQGLVNVTKAVAELDGIPLLVVHDEIVVECPIPNAVAVLELTEEALVAAYDLDPPLSVSGSIVTTSYADA